MTDTADVTTLGYETARDELAQVVSTLEHGGLGLDESLALWERGERLAKHCLAQLQGASERIESALQSGDAADD